MTIAVADGAVTEFPERYADTTFTEWLPDGSGFLFVARKTGSAAPGFAGQIYLQPFPSGPVQRITNDLVDYRTARPGPDSRSLLAIGYDASASIWTAAVDDPASARQLPSSLRRDGFFGIDWTPDASRLVFGTFLRDHRETWTVAADGSDRRELLTEGQGFGTRVSPDGTFITFYGERSGGTGIWRARLDGTDARLLVPMIGSGQMSISSDGQWVYFSSPRSGAPSTYRVSTSGGEAILVADKLDQGVISPDGTLVAGIWDTVNGQSIGVLPVAGGPPVFVSQGVGFPTGQVTMLWSPDGKSVLYNSVERMNVWRQALAGGPPQKVTAFDDQTIFRFALTNDGKRLALVRGRQIRDALMISNFR
jgi:Tol biopolymer transport system component